MKITILPHARERMHERGISEGQVHGTLEQPWREYRGNKGRTVAVRRVGQHHAIKVVDNLGPADERIVVTVLRGRPRR